MCAYGFDCYLKFLAWKNNEVKTVKNICIGFFSNFRKPLAEARTLSHNNNVDGSRIFEDEKWISSIRADLEPYPSSCEKRYRYCLTRIFKASQYFWFFDSQTCRQLFKFWKIEKTLNYCIVQSVYIWFFKLQNLQYLNYLMDTVFY